MTQISAFLKAGLFAGLAAAAINALVYFLGRSLGWITDDVLLPGAEQPLTLPPVIMASLVPALIAAVVAWLVNRFTRRPRQVFTGLAVVLLVLTLVPPFSLPGASGGMIFALVLMHVVAAAAIVYFLVRPMRAGSGVGLA